MADKILHYSPPNSSGKFKPDPSIPSAPIEKHKFKSFKQASPEIIREFRNKGFVKSMPQKATSPLTWILSFLYKPRASQIISPRIWQHTEVISGAFEKFENSSLVFRTSVGELRIEDPEFVIAPSTIPISGNPVEIHILRNRDNEAEKKIVVDLLGLAPADRSDIEAAFADTE
jgi:hypothetical protein